MRHDIENTGTMSEQYPHLIFSNFTSKLGKRCVDILKYLFPVPKEDSKRVLTFSNNQDYISFRHHVFKKSTENRNEIDLDEVGPRFELKCKCRYNNHILKYYKSIIMKQSITIIPRYRRVHTPRYLEYRVICDRFIPLLMLIKFQCLNYPKNTILKIKRKIHLF